MEELSIKDAAKALGVHPNAVRRMLSKGDIAAKKRGKHRLLVLPSAVQPASTAPVLERHSAIDTVRTTKDVITQTRDVDITEVSGQLSALIELVKHMTAKIDELDNKVETLSQRPQYESLKVGFWGRLFGGGKKE